MLDGHPPPFHLKQKNWNEPHKLLWVRMSWIPVTQEKTELLGGVDSIVTIESNMNTDERFEDWI